jgi:two-component system CheB/CheR fusion protein
MVDYKVPVEAMPDILIQYVQHTGGLMEPSSSETAAPDQLSSILDALRVSTQYDFHGYKKGTLLRRIERRMGLNHLSTIAEYVRVVQESEPEARRLFKDLLIGVTGFYRDPEAYQQLDKAVIQSVVREKETLEPIRAWVPGCATGEEPYSIAITVMDTIKDTKEWDIQIIATDASTEALDRDALDAIDSAIRAATGVEHVPCTPGEHEADIALHRAAPDHFHRRGQRQADDDLALVAVQRDCLTEIGFGQL